MNYSQQLFTKSIIALNNNLNKFINRYHSGNDKITGALNQLNESVDMINHSIENDNDIYKNFLSFTKSYFLTLSTLLKAIKEDKENIAPTTMRKMVSYQKDGNFIATQIIDIVQVYQQMINSYATTVNNDMNNLKISFDRKKSTLTTNHISESSDKGIPTSITISKNIENAFDTMGDLLNKGMDIMGKQLGSLFIKLGNGAENVAYCITVINDKGFDAFLDDSKCMDCVKDVVVYSIIFLAVWSIVKIILRKVGGFLSWLGN